MADLFVLMFRYANLRKCGAQWHLVSVSDIGGGGGGGGGGGSGFKIHLYRVEILSTQEAVALSQHA